MPVVFEPATITRLAQEAENIFAREFPCIIERESLNIVAGTALYTLPDYVIDIRKITWLGKRLDVLTNRSYRDGQFPSTTSSTPTDYTADNLGQMNIRFFPTPSASVASIGTNLWGSEIRNRVIVEYYRTPDYITYTIPMFFRRRLIKAYVLKQCFSLEGRGKNLKAAKYWSQKWIYLKEQYGQLLDTLVNEPRRIVIGQSVKTGFVLPRPVLPYDKIGIGVDKGE